jgi:hypothetical protein
MEQQMLKHLCQKFLREETSRALRYSWKDIIKVGVRYEGCRVVKCIDVAQGKIHQLIFVINLCVIYSIYLC